MSQIQTIFEVLSASPDNFSQFRPELVNNANAYFGLFQDQRFQKESSTDTKKYHLVLKILGLYMENFKFDENSFDSLLLPVSFFYLMNDYCKNYRNEVSKICCSLFKLANKHKREAVIISLFQYVSSQFDANVFVNVKAYLLYYSYQQRNFSSVSNLLDNFNIELISTKYNDHIDYCMFHFYRGLIALINKNLFKAAISFLCTMKVRVQGGLYNAYQMESVRRLILLSYLVDSNVKKAITETLTNHKILMFIKPISIYDEFNKILTGKNPSYKEVEKFFNDHKPRFKDHKTKGLVKLCIREFIFNKLNTALKTYRRIRIEKLATTVEIEKDLLISSLKQFSLRNKINVKVNEIANTVEVLDEDFDEKLSVNELKNIYSNLNQLQIEMIDFAFQKNFKLVKRLQNAMKMESSAAMAGMMGRGDVDMDEDDN